MALNVVVVKSGDRTILIDAGLGADPDLKLAASGSMIQRLEAAGIDLTSVRTWSVTHLHMDHIGGLLVGGVRDGLPSRLADPSSAAEAEFWRRPILSRFHAAWVPRRARRAAKRFLNEYGSQLRPFEDGV